MKSEDKTEYRQKFDYVDFAEPDEDLVKSYLKEARIFMNVIKEYLSNKLNVTFT